jgi:hypothetical protein
MSIIFKSISSYRREIITETEQAAFNTTGTGVNMEESPRKRKMLKPSRSLQITPNRKESQQPKNMESPP